MNPWIALPLAGLVGMGLGLFYFGGLWFTLRSLPRVRWPIPLLIGSFAFRTAVVVIGFYLVMDGSWQRIVACLVGFILVRVLIVSKLRSDGPAADPSRRQGA